MTDCLNCGTPVEAGQGTCGGCGLQLVWQIAFGGGDWPLVEVYGTVDGVAVKKVA